METDRLRYFCTIAEFESLTKAAEVLNISHSGLSKAMSILQQETSLKLFQPAGRGIEITKQGREFYSKAKSILELVKDLSAPNSLAIKSPPIRIGLQEIFSISISGLLAIHLGNSVQFFEHDSGQSEVELLSGNIDFAISCILYPHKDLEYMKIKRIPLGVFSTNPKFLKLKLSDLNFVIPSIKMHDNPLSLKFRDGWPSSIDRHCPLSAGSLTSALSIVDKGITCVFIPVFVANLLNQHRSTENQLLQIELDNKIFKDSTRDVFLVKRKDQQETKAMKIAAKIIRQNC